MAKYQSVSKLEIVAIRRSQARYLKGLVLAVGAYHGRCMDRGQDGPLKISWIFGPKWCII
jgi:hypothetical protein